MSKPRPKNGFETTLHEVATVVNQSIEVIPSVELAFSVLLSALGNGNKVLTCGNGGSAADAMHMTEELLGKFKIERAPLASYNLNSDGTVLTCISNDFGFEEVFARQVRALSQPNDVLVAFSTSGNSENIVRALAAARDNDVRTILLTGQTGGRSAEIAELSIKVPSTQVERIQEMHTVILHYWLSCLDEKFCN